MIGGSLLLLQLLATLSSPYPYEVRSGLSLELKSSALVTDSADDRSVGTGARLSYALPSPIDAYLSFEAEFNYFYLLKKNEGLTKRERNRQKTSGYLNLVAVEIFNPFAWRLGLGGGIERRQSWFSPAFQYRGGLGWFFHPRFGLWAEATGHVYFRSQSTDQGLELGLSLQSIF